MGEFRLDKTDKEAEIIVLFKRADWPESQN